MSKWLRKVGAVGVVAAVVFLLAVARSMSIEEQSFRAAVGTGIAGVLFFAAVAVFLAVGFPDYLADKSSDHEEPGAWPPAPIEPLSDDEKASLLRDSGYRKKIEYHGSTLVVGAAATVIVALAAAASNGLQELGVSSSVATGASLGLAVALACGASLAGWRYLKRPVLPDDPRDLERELRHRWHSQ